MNELAEQFAQDWLLVIENDQDSWNQLVEDVKSMNCDPIATTAFLREEWDYLVDQIADLVYQVSEIGSLLVRQMLGTGDYAHQLIANHVISSIKETEKHQLEVNDLVKNMEESNA